MATRGKRKIFLGWIGVFLATLLTIILFLFQPSAKINDFTDYRFKESSGNQIPEGKIKITYLGVATLLLDDGETQILTDGFVTRPSLLDVGFGKIQADTAIIRSVIKELKINKLEGIFTAHSHYDHAMDAPYFCKFTNAKLYGSESTLNIGRGAGLPEGLLEGYEPGRSLQIGKFIVTIINSKHTPISFPRNNDLGKVITKPLSQPAKLEAFVEGGAYDIFIQHGDHSILVKASTNYIKNALDNIKADIVFLGMATLSQQDTVFQNNYYDYTIAKVCPRIVIPIHWDNFFKPLNKELVAYWKITDNVENGFNFLIRRTKRDSIDFKIMQGFESVILF